MTAPHIYTAMNQVHKRIAKEGITKERWNEQQKFKFRGIDDVFNVMSPILAECGMLILPRVVSRNQTERTTQKGGILTFAVVCMEFDFVSCEDGSKHTVSTYGEAMDSGDKATNKAMATAYKYAILQAFAIPTETSADNDYPTDEPAAIGPVLGHLRNAALLGMDSLKKAFAEHKGEPGFADVWTTNREALQTAAQAVDTHKVNDE